MNVLCLSGQVEVGNQVMWRVEEDVLGNGGG